MCIRDRVRTFGMSAGWAYCVSMTVPPVNSIEKCSPRVARKKTAARNVSSEMTLNTSACRMNGMSRWMRKNSIGRRLSERSDGKACSGLGRRRRGARLPDLADRHRLQALLAAVPEVHEAAREHHRREHRGDDAQAMDDREGADRPRAEGEQRQAGDQRRHVRV